MNWKTYEDNMELSAITIYEWLEQEFSKLKTGRASPKLLDNIKIDYYGDMTPIYQTANINVPEPRVMYVKPYDKAHLKDIATAINNSHLDINSQVDADRIKITFPTLTEATRKEMAKKAKSMGEAAKVKVRKIRQHEQDNFKKDDEVTEDDKKYFNTQIDKLTKSINVKIDTMVSQKEKGIMTI